MGAHRPHDREHVRALFTEFAATDPTDPRHAELRDELVTCNLGLVRYLAQRFTGRGEALDDLIQVGTVGLLHAVDRFDPSRGLEFSTFATPTITGEIKRHFRDHGWMVRAPRQLQEMRTRLTAGIETLSQQLGRSPTVAELAGHLDVSEDLVLEGMESARAYSALSLDVPVAEDGRSIGDTLADDDGALEQVELRHALRPVLAKLSDRQQRVLMLRVLQEQSQSDIAAQLGVSQVQVSRILAKTFAGLREDLAELNPARADV